MATYNGARYIEEQLQSFVEQTRQPDELIITDDCSSDQTEAIVREFATTAPFAVEFHRNQESLGYCGNFSAALTKTTGDLVFLSDQDDVWFPEKIEYMLNVAEHNSEALVLMNDATLTDGELNEVGLTKIGQIKSAGFSMKSFVMGCCCAIRRELLDLSLPIGNGYKGHDNWLVFFAEGLDAKLIEEKSLQYYRRHESNESQFIANRTTKVTRFHRFLHQFRVLFSSRQDESMNYPSQHDIFAEGVKRAMRVSPEFYRDKLQSLYDETMVVSRLHKRRAEIRSQGVLKRICGIASLCRDGSLSNKYRFKSAVRDLVG
ncbi:glycosyltransferase [Chromohalobacter sp. 48-RD10]|uniref:glycosyltransferase n=1 Tax=Chromohalobacter sp. 48-RD10 TaxID=2994063 RepID=UPI0024696C95|nr:glycosyltransferase [Chromohalobacter sp. 48-RD10]